MCCDERGVGVRGPPRAPVASGARCRGSCKRLGRASGIRPLWVPGSMLQAGGTRGQRRLRVRGIRRRHRLIGYVDRGLPEDASLSWRSDRSVCSSNQHLPNLYCRARRECRDFRHGRENPRSFKGAIHGVVRHRDPNSSGTRMIRLLGTRMIRSLARQPPRF